MMTLANLVDERDNRLVADKPIANDTSKDLDTSMEEIESLDIESRAFKELINDLEELRKLAYELKEKQKELKRRIAKREKFLRDLKKEKE